MDTPKQSLPSLKTSTKVALVVSALAISALLVMIIRTDFEKAHLASIPSEVACVPGKVTSMSAFRSTKNSGIDRMRMYLETLSQPKLSFEVIARYQQTIFNDPHFRTTDASVCYLKQFPDTAVDVLYNGASVNTDTCRIFTPSTDGYVLAAFTVLFWAVIIFILSGKTITWHRTQKRL